MQSLVSRAHAIVSFTHYSLDLPLCHQRVQSQLDFLTTSLEFLTVIPTARHPPTMNHLASSPTYPDPAHIPPSKPPGYDEATALESQPANDDDDDHNPPLPAYSPPRPSVPWPRESETALFHTESTVRPNRLGSRKNRTLVCFILLAFLLVAIFIVVVIIEIMGHLNQGP